MFAYFHRLKTRHGLASSVIVLAIQISTIPAAARVKPGQTNAIGQLPWLRSVGCTLDRLRGDFEIRLPLNN